MPVVKLCSTNSTGKIIKGIREQQDVFQMCYAVSKVGKDEVQSIHWDVQLTSHWGILICKEEF